MGDSRRPAAELDRVLDGQLQLEVPEQLDLVWKIGIRTGVDAAELATFARIEPARGHIDILRLDLEQSALPLPSGRCGCSNSRWPMPCPRTPAGRGCPTARRDRRGPPACTRRVSC